MNAKRLIEIRELNNYTQKDIANILNISLKQYNRYEKDICKISIDKLIILADIYNTSLDYLLGLTDEIKPYPLIKPENRNLL